MKVLTAIIFLQLSIGAPAQKPGDKMPPFKTVLSNGSFFSVQDLKKDRPVILIYFAPDCDHCKILMKDFFNRVADFSKAEVVMITYRPLKEIAGFISEYGIANYPNITVGMEVPTYFIRYYFKLTHTPFTALYNKKGQLLYSYPVKTDMPDLVHRLKGAL